MYADVSLAVRRHLARGLGEVPSLSPLVVSSTLTSRFGFESPTTSPPLYYTIVVHDWKGYRVEKMVGLVSPTDEAE